MLIDAHTLLYLASGSDGSGLWLYDLNLKQRIPHRFSFGLEHYSSLSANASGMRLLATVDDSQSSIWSVPFGMGAGMSAGQLASQPASLGPAAALSPRVGADFFVYVSACAGLHGIWKSVAGQSHKLWSNAHAIIVSAPVLDRDGRQIVFTVVEGERTVLKVMDIDGRNLRGLAPSLDLRGNPTWAPDGRSIVSAVLRDGEPRLMSIPLDEGPPRLLVSEYSIDPVCRRMVNTLCTRVRMSERPFLFVPWRGTAGRIRCLRSC